MGKKPQAGMQLPPLLSVVLYNGECRWNAAATTRELIELSPDSPLWRWQPRARYRVLDMGDFAKDELARRTSLVALLFRLEQRHSLEGLRELLDEVIGWFRRHKGYERLRKLFAELVRAALARHRVSLPRSSNLLEVKSMLTIDFEAGKEKWVAKGKAEGLAEGMAMGKAEGKAEALIDLLAKRFGAVSASRQKRIRGARLATLNRWFKRAIIAPDLTSVFNPPR